jgi:tRNA pseudouridine55 synthase
MRSTQRKGREVAGFLLLDKPQGLTSNRALQRTKRIFDAAKAGHGGSLDPLATGMLPICFGSATKVSRYILEAAKTYSVTMRLGIATDTGDADGEVIDTHDATGLTKAEVIAALHAMLGTIQQTPPMYSAVKHNGQRLYTLARQGVDVPRRSRPVTIHEARLELFDFPHIRFVVRCSKGTYVRSLVEALAGKLGTLGHVAALRRLAVSPFEESRMWTLHDLEAIAQDGYEALDGLLHPVDSVLAGWPSLVLGTEDATRISQGQKLEAAEGTNPGLCRIYTEGEDFIGIGEVIEGPMLVPRRIFFA